MSENAFWKSDHAVFDFALEIVLAECDVELEADDFSEQWEYKLWNNLIFRSEKIKLVNNLFLAKCRKHAPQLIDLYRVGNWDKVGVKFLQENRDHIFLERVDQRSVGYVLHVIVDFWNNFDEVLVEEELEEWITLGFAVVCQVFSRLLYQIDVFHALSQYHPHVVDYILFKVFTVICASELAVWLVPSYHYCFK